jgi:hypothetical protein
MRARLFDGRMAMARESLKLTENQLTLWTPIEAQLRATFVARQKAHADREARLQSGDRAPLAPPDRLDRASQRASERAERLKALAQAFRPFYASLSDEQKAVASVVLRPALGERGHGGRHWHMRRAEAPEHR